MSEFKIEIDDKLKSNGDAEVWKYNIGMSVETLNIPNDAIFLNAKIFHKSSYYTAELWFWIPDSSDDNYVNRTFMLVETGQHISNGKYKYLTTHKFEDGYVLHLFEVCD